MSGSLRPHGLQLARLPCPSPSPGAWSLVQWWVITTGNGKKFFDVHSFIDKTRQLSTSCLRSTVLGARLLVPMGDVACQVPLSMEISRQEYWSGFPFPSPALQADALLSEPP